MIKLKGGSLSSTYLMNEHTQNPFIRKKVSLLENREYGYIRWYSQLKKLQRLQKTGVFPKVLDVQLDNPQTAYFDLEFMSGYQDIKTLLSGPFLGDFDIGRIHGAFVKALHSIHIEENRPALKGGPMLYYQEEVAKKIGDACKASDDFRQFANRKAFNFNGAEILNIDPWKLTKYFGGVKLGTEGAIHGNPTLENALYSKALDRVFFVDPYEESIIDTRFLDYAQVLQCCKSYYGVINDSDVVVDNTEYMVKVSTKYPHSLANFRIFNDRFERHLSGLYTPEQIRLINVLEATQFFRMAPFKVMAGDIDHAKYFYVHGCYRLQEIL